jgi:hypothetical protein
MMEKPTAMRLLQEPVCSLFVDYKSTLGKRLYVDPTKIRVATAQAQLPATDVYINTVEKVLNKYFSQSTILHEALHNLTHLDDDDLKVLLGIPVGSSSTNIINEELEKNGCVDAP